MLRFMIFRQKLLYTKTVVIGQNYRIFGQRLSYRRPEAEPGIESGLQGACLFVPLTIDYIFPSPVMQSPLDIALD